MIESLGRIGPHDVQSVTLTGRNGTRAKVMTWGARLAELWVPAAKGKLADIDPRFGALMLMGMLQFYFLAYPVTSRVVGEMTPERLATLKQHVKRVFLRGVLA